MQICTIVARNYLAAARVLARSFSDVHPDGRCWVLVIDDPEGLVDDAGEPFSLVRPEQLEIGLWDQMCAGYDVLELSTAVKPWLLRYLMRAGGTDRITYLDPDIQVFDSLREIDDLLGEHALVVNPHLTAPIPRDGHRPAETDILIAGSFNLGFVGFAAGPQTDMLLDWWSERLATDCLVAPERGYFVDQRWMDLAPGLITSLFVLRDPGYNVAYWNLPGRELTTSGQRTLVNGRPLRFFHFSGYDPRHPERLSKHQDRIELDQDPVLHALCDGYADALHAEGHDRAAQTPYGWGTLPDGTRLDRVARAVYRDGVEAGELPVQSVFTRAGGESLLAYLSGPASHGGRQGVSRYMHQLWRSRSDLRDAFPDLDGPDGTRFRAWTELAVNGIPPAVRPPSELGGPPQLGVNVVGYLKGVMGVGEHGRQLLAALRSQQIPVSTTTISPDAAPEDEALADRPARSGSSLFRYFNLLSVNADMTAPVVEQLGQAFFADRYTIAFWAWEVSTFPQRSTAAFAHVDEVWVGSRHVRDAITPAATVPVLVIPQPVSLPDGYAAAPPPEGLRDGFRFMFAFDYLSVFERKNPLAVVDAFTHAFEPADGATLVLKTLNHEHDPTSHERLQRSVHGRPDIQLLTQRLTAPERDGLLNAADCYVSLHRAEGFGYTLAESMWAGKPVIATGYSGNLDFMSSGNSYLVDHRLVPIGPGHEPYPADAVWAEPSVDHAARLMREVFEDRDAAARRGERAAVEIRASHGPPAAGKVMADRLSLLLTAPGWRSGRYGSGRSGYVQTDWVDRLIRSGPVATRGRPRFGRPQAVARRGLLRALKPLTVHERLVSGELLKAIETLSSNVQALSVSQQAARRRIQDLEGELDGLRRGPDAADETQANDARNGRS